MPRSTPFVSPPAAAGAGTRVVSRRLTRCEWQDQNAPSFVSDGGRRASCRGSSASTCSPAPSTPAP